MLYQIIHTFEGFLNEPQLDGMTILLGRNEEASSVKDIDFLLAERLKRLQEGGIEGLVINVGGIGYLESSEGWSLFIRGLEKSVEMGFKIWLYDEKGYPSGSAGGLTLHGNPEYEAMGVKYAVLKAENEEAHYGFKEKGGIEILHCDLVNKPGIPNSKSITKSTHGELIEQWQSKRYVSIREEGLLELHLYYTAALYEGTHASRSYAEKRRYINLLDTRAVSKFTEVTHRFYASRIPASLFKRVEAFFTDEPSFMSVVLPALDGQMVEKIPVMDETDPEVPLLPAVPYSQELQNELVKRYGISLNEVIPKLFETSEEPSVEKCMFWEAVAHVYEKAFAVTLEEACAEYGKSLTGHILYEESPFGNVLFHSNPFRILKHFHLPGTDLLSNKTQNINIFAHKLPFSCSFLQGRAGIMSETSDFAEHRFDEKMPASAQNMTSALSKQYLLGVRKFSYYYDFRARSTEEYWAANSIIKRTCAYGEKFEFSPELAVYCPYETFWSGYAPTASELNDVLREQVSYIKETEASLIALCDELFTQNVQFVLVDESSIQELIEKGVKKVFLPTCKVISKALEDAALEGKLELYGVLPAYVYDKGLLRKPDRLLEARDYSLIKRKSVPFGVSEGLLYSAFKGGSYYLYNSNHSESCMAANGSLEIYDPYTDRTLVKQKGDRISILPGQGIFAAVMQE